LLEAKLIGTPNPICAEYISIGIGIVDLDAVAREERLGRPCRGGIGLKTAIRKTWKIYVLSPDIPFSPERVGT
jgi:hypothetical protein